MADRHWSDSLHRAVEAKEGVSITVAAEHAAQITFQSCFRLYKKLAGMSGTSRLGRRIGTDDSDKLIGQVAERGDGIADTAGESYRVRWIGGAGDDALVRQALPMKPPKVGVIVG